MLDVRRIGFTELCDSEGTKDDLQGIKKVKYGSSAHDRKV